ncbi:MAG: hypothetical protein GXO75_19405 [Calditrichaeota bacterium]|nr:hypothetical protein [Calditrichota bacterium]
MKKYMILFIFLYSSSCFSQSIVRIAVGNTFYTSKINVGGSEISQNGATLSLYFPIRFPSLDAHLKMGVSRHFAVQQSPQVEYHDELRIDELYNCTNEILVGHTIQLSDRFSLLPQFGFGALGELLTYTSGWRQAHVDLFTDASILFNINFGSMSAGLLFNLEKDFGLGEPQSNGVRFRSQIALGL